MAIEAGADDRSAKSAGLLQRIVRLGRFLVFLATAGWIFPHACTEGMDLSRIQDEHSAKLG